MLPGLETFGVSAWTLPTILTYLCPSPFWFLHQRDKGSESLFWVTKNMHVDPSRAPHLPGSHVGSSGPRLSLFETPSY